MVFSFRQIFAKIGSGRGDAFQVEAADLAPDNDSPGQMSQLNGRRASSVSFQLSPTNAIGGIHGNQALLKLVDTFAPSQPVLNITQFAGRARQLKQLIAAVEERRNHVVVFGPKGSGKTSLTMALLSIATRINYTTIYLSCSRSSTVDSIFRSVLARLPRRYDRLLDPLTDPSGPAETFATLLPSGAVSPQFLAELLARVTGTRVIIVLDEFDRPEYPTLGVEMLELMKSLSDHVAAVHIILVGAGDGIEDLLGNVSLIPRTLFSLNLPMMDDVEIASILALLSQATNLQMTPAVVQRITALAEGRPFIAKLVGLQTSKTAVLNGDRILNEAHLDIGLEQLVDQLSSASFSQLQAIAAQNGRLLPILRAVLRAIREKGDMVTAEQVAQQCNTTFGIENAATIERALTLLADSGRTWFAAIEKDGRTRFRFVDPAMEFLIATLCAAAPAPAVERNTLEVTRR